LGTTVPILSKLFSGRQMAWNRICCGVTKASLFWTILRSLLRRNRSSLQNICCIEAPRTGWLWR